jgi:hypothetical protein
MLFSSWHSPFLFEDAGRVFRIKAGIAELFRVEQ